jgi:hypothetical protein
LLYFWELFSRTSAKSLVLYGFKAGRVIVQRKAVRASQGRRL